MKIAYNAAKVMTSINFVGGLLVDHAPWAIPTYVHDPRYAFARLQWVIEYNADKTESFWAGKLPNATGHSSDTWARPTILTFHQTINGSGVAEFTRKGNYDGDGSGTGAYKSLVATADGIGFMTDTVGYGVYRGLTRFKSLGYDSGSVMRDEKPFVWFTPRPPSDFSLSVSDTIDVQIGGVFGRIDPVTYDLTDPTVSDVIDPRNKTIYIYVTLELGEPRLNFREIPMAESVYTAYIGKVITDDYGIMEVDIQPLTRIGNYRPSATPRGSSFSVSSGTADTERLLNWDANVFNSVGQEGPQQSGNVPLGVISKPGTYEYVVAPGDNFTIELLGAGGGGGASRMSSTGIDGINGGAGGDTIFYIEGQALLTATGGPGGLGGTWGGLAEDVNGSAGPAAVPKINNGADYELSVSKIELYTGRQGGGFYYDRNGGVPVYQLDGVSGIGGVGAPRRAGDSEAFGGGGSSGSNVSFKLRNNTNAGVRISFKIGTGGAGGTIRDSRDAAGTAGANGAVRIGRL